MIVKRDNGEYLNVDLTGATFNENTRELKYYYGIFPRKIILDKRWLCTFGDNQEMNVQKVINNLG